MLRTMVFVTVVCLVAPAVSAGSPMTRGELIRALCLELRLTADQSISIDGALSIARRQELLPEEYQDPRPLLSPSFIESIQLRLAALNRDPAILDRLSEGHLHQQVAVPWEP
ncbi:hypothetical protein JW905_07380 [bacterium]|nr:hypothetical protein [candidate division CSSED10-310 bacterium]